MEAVVLRGEMGIGAAPAAMRLCLLQGMNVSSATHLSLEGEEGDMVGEMGEVRTIYIMRAHTCIPTQFHIIHTTLVNTRASSVIPIYLRALNSYKT